MKEKTFEEKLFELLGGLEEILKIKRKSDSNLSREVLRKEIGRILGGKVTVEVEFGGSYKDEA